MTLFTVKLRYLEIILIILQTINFTYANDDHHCIWYGECHQDSKNHSQNCHYDGKPKILEDKVAQKLMLERCPHIYPNSK